jgi:hypothetical protein
MKKILLLLIVSILTISVSAQTRLKDTVYIYEGLRIGSESGILSADKIDSVKIVGDSLAYYVAGVAYYGTKTGGLGSAEGNFLPLTLVANDTVNTGTNELWFRTTDGISQSVSQLYDDGAFYMYGHPTSNYVNTTSSFTFGDGLSNLRATSGGSSTTLGISNSSGITVTDNLNFGGIKYVQDYSNYYTSRSLVDSGFVSENFLTTSLSENDTVALNGNLLYFDNDSADNRFQDSYYWISGETGFGASLSTDSSSINEVATLQVGFSSVGANYYPFINMNVLHGLVSSSIKIDSSEMKVSDAINTKGLVYEADYSANYTAQSLVDSGFVANIAQSLDSRIDSSKLVFNYQDSTLHVKTATVDSLFVVNDSTLYVTTVGHMVGINNANPQTGFHVTVDTNTYAGARIENISDGVLASGGISLRNDVNRLVGLGISGSNNALFGPDVGVLINGGYNDMEYIIDGNHDHVWYTDVTDTHFFVWTEKMRLSAGGKLTVDTIHTDSIKTRVLDYNPPHGVMVFSDSTVTPDLTQNIWMPITNDQDSLYAKLEATNITLDGDSITAIIPGSYIMSVTLSFSGSINDVYHMAIFKNNAITRFESHRKTSNSDTGFFGVDGYLELEAGDDISIRIRNTANSNDPTFISSQVIIYMLHPN